MKQTKLLGIILFAVGAVLLFFGLNAANSPIEEIGEALTGRYSNETMLYLVGGAVLAVVGFIMLIRRR